MRTEGGDQSTSSKQEDSGLFSSPSDIPDSPSLSPVTYKHKPISRTHSLRYSGGAVHTTDQPVSFDHNFESWERDVSSRAQSSSPTESEAESGLTVKHLSRQRQLPPLVRVQADLAAENGGR